MKKLILILAFASIFQVLNAQVTTETYSNKNILGGSFSFSFSDNYGFFPEAGIIFVGLEDFNVTSFRVSPYFGREITPHITLGLKFDYNNHKMEQDREDLGQLLLHSKVNLNVFGLGIFSRYTFNPENKFNLFVEPYFSYNKTNREHKIDNVLDSKEESNYIKLGVGVGALYSISNSIRASVKVGAMEYLNGNKESTNEKSTDFSHFGTSFNLSSIFFGFEIIL